MKLFILTILLLSITVTLQSKDSAENTENEREVPNKDEDHDGFFNRNSELNSAKHDENEHDHEEHEHSHDVTLTKKETDHHHHHDHIEHEKETETDKTKIWCYAISSVLAISILPCFILFFIPIQNANGPILKILLAFGAGGLLGDALLHIIPHSLHPHQHHDHDGHNHKHSHEHEHEHGHDHSNELRVGCQVILGILAFLIVEQFVRICKGGHCHNHKVHDHEHEMLPKENKNDTNTENVEKNHHHANEIKASAYLNLVADFVHNFTDGLAIGASYTAGNYIGLVTTLTVLLHELPHEVGDFAILVQSGFSKWKAIRLQLITALGAVCGCIISLIVSNPNELASGTESSWIMPFTAGGFIYIATVSVIPEILENDSSLHESKCKMLLNAFLHTFAFVFGVGMMYCVSYFE